MRTAVVLVLLSVVLQSSSAFEQQDPFRLSSSHNAHHRRLLQATATAAEKTNSTNSTNAMAVKASAPASAPASPPLWQSIYTVLVVFFMFCVLATEYFHPECVMLAALTVLMCSGFLPTSSALVGFSNEGMLTVIALMAFAQGLESAGALEVLRCMLEFGTGPTTSIQFILLRLCIIAGTISAFLNNTPVVAFFIPVLQEFCAKYGFSTAEVMLPLSYSVILGGTVTTIGTSTNLVATGLYAAKLNAVHKTTSYNANNVLSLFELGKIGLPVLLAGVAYIVIVSPILFRGRRVKPWVPDHVKTYSLYLRVSRGCALISKTIADSGLSNLSATLVAHIKPAAAAGGAAEDKAGGGFGVLEGGGVIEEGDTLVFTSEVQMLPELMRFHGLDFASLQDGDDGLFGAKDTWHSAVYIDDRRLVEAVVGCGSAAVGLRPDAAFREAYGGFVVAVHRHGVPLLSHDSVALQAGDALLVLTTDAFVSKYTRDSTFALLRLVASYRPRRHRYAPLLGTLSLVLMIMLSQFLNEPQYGNISILKTALCGMIFMAMTGCASQIEMRSGAKVDLLIMIAVGFGLSEALTISGGAKMVAGWIVNAAQGNAVGLVAGTYFVVTLFNAAVTNNAAVSIFFPIAWEVAAQSKMDFYPILLTLMFAGSADFSTPYGYQCNLMVYEPGGYSFLDYIKFGLPLQIVCAIFTVAIVFSLDYWWAYAVAFAVLSPIAVVALFFCRARDAHPPSDAAGDKGPAAADLVALEEAKPAAAAPARPASPPPLPTAGSGAAGGVFA